MAAVAAALLLPATARAPTPAKTHAPDHRAHLQAATGTAMAFCRATGRRWRRATGLPILGPEPRHRREPRFIDFYGNVRYGWRRARASIAAAVNGGSFGPCYDARRRSARCRRAGSRFPARAGRLLASPSLEGEGGRERSERPVGSVRRHQSPTRAARDPPGGCFQTAHFSQRSAAPVI